MSNNWEYNRWNPVPEEMKSKREKYRTKMQILNK